MYFLIQIYLCVQKTTFIERFQGRLKEAHLIFKNSNRWRTSNIMDIFNYLYSKVKVGAQQNVPGSGNALNFAKKYNHQPM